MNADLHYLDADAVWTQDLSEDGQTLIVTMTPGNGDHAADAGDHHRAEWKHAGDQSQCLRGIEGD